MDKTVAEQIGDLVTLALSCPVMGFGGGSLTEERAQDRWALRVHAEAERLHRLVLGGDPKAVRLIEMIQREIHRPNVVIPEALPFVRWPVQRLMENHDAVPPDGSAVVRLPAGTVLRARPTNTP